MSSSGLFSLDVALTLQKLSSCEEKVNLMLLTVLILRPEPVPRVSSLTVGFSKNYKMTTEKKNPPNLYCAFCPSAHFWRQAKYPAVSKGS